MGDRAVSSITLAVIKPGAVERGSAPDLLAVMRRHFEVASVRWVIWSREFAERFYAEHRGKPFFERLVEHASSGPCAEVALVAPNAVDAVGKWRRLIGPTDPADGMAEEEVEAFLRIGRRPAAAAGLPLRQVYGRALPDNALHGSSDAAAAERELELVGFLKRR